MLQRENEAFQVQIQQLKRQHLAENHLAEDELNRLRAQVEVLTATCNAQAEQLATQQAASPKLAKSAFSFRTAESLESPKSPKSPKSLKSPKSFQQESSEHHRVPTLMDELNALHGSAETDKARDIESFYFVNLQRIERKLTELSEGCSPEAQSPRRRRESLEQSGPCSSTIYKNHMKKVFGLTKRPN